MNMDQEVRDILNPGRTALLVWDVQNMLVESIFNREEFLSNERKVISAARQKGVPVFFSRITPLPEKFDSPVRKFMVKRRNLALKQVPNSHDLTIEALKDELVIPKNTTSIFIGTNFEQVLRNGGISTILFTGIATEMGIESSARDAFNRGFYPVIISDAVSSMNEEAHRRSLENLKSLLIVLKADEVIGVW